jgi:hypothetical protein
MGKSKAPAAPDPYATAQAQGTMNRETAQAQAGLNMVNQYTPSGILEYAQIGQWADGTPRFSATQALAPSEQRQMDMSNRAQELYGQAGVSQLERLQGTMSTPFNPSLSGGVGDYSAMFSRYGDPNIGRDQVENALMSRMQPQMDRDRAALETRLANQGIGYGSEAYSGAMDDFNRGVNDARLGAITQAGQEQSRLAGLAQNDAGFQNAYRQQSLQEQLALRNQPLNELAALLSGSQVQMPQFTNTPQTGVQGTDLSGDVYNTYSGQVGAVNSRNQQKAATAGGVASLAAAAAIAI